MQKNKAVIPRTANPAARLRAPQYFLARRLRSQNPAQNPPAQNPDVGFTHADPSHRTLAKTPETVLSVGSRIFPKSTCEMLGFLDNFRQPFHKFQNRRGTFSLAVHLPREIGLPATGGLVRAIFLGPPVRLWSRKVSRCFALLKPRKLIGKQKALFRVGIVSLDFHSTKYFMSGFALCFDIIVMPEQGDCCIFTLFKMAFGGNFASN